MDHTEKLKDHSYLKELSTALAKANDAGVIQRFLESLLTSTELETISTRWALVRLIKGGMSQRRISEVLGLSLCKITRGSRELQRENSPFAEMISIFER